MWAKIKKFVKKHRSKIILTIGILTVGYCTFDYLTKKSEVKLSAFFKAIKEGFIQEVIIEEGGSHISFRSFGDQWYSTFLGTFPSATLLSLIKSHNIMYSFQPESISKNFIFTAFELATLLGPVLFLGKEIVDGPTEGVNFSSQIYKNDCSFNDVYGGQLIKAKFKQIIDFIRNPEKFQKFGARIRRGVLLYGPPGTGKTMLARALANEAQCEFIKAAASQFQQLFVGMGAKRVRDLFKEAKKHTNGCIIFIDEIDALGNRVNALRDNSETTSTITQFLSQLDGFQPLDKVVVVASTNRIDLVDAAILRMGRFDIKVQINLPGKEQRLGIMKTIINKKLKKHEISQEALENVSQSLQGYSGADLQALINESVYRAIRQDSPVVKEHHFTDLVGELLSR